MFSLGSLFGRRRGSGGASPVPVKTGNPTISAPSLAVGSTATAVHGTYTGTITGYTQQWLRNGVPISGATGLTYQFQTADAGKSVTYSEAAYYSSPVYSSATGTSNALAVDASGGGAGAINAPVLTRTTAANVNPMLVDINLDATTHIYDAIASPDGTFDFIQMRRAATSDYSGAVTDFVRLTQDMGALNDASFPNTMLNMPAGSTYLSSRIRRGSVPGRIVNEGDSISYNQFNWIYQYSQANPGLEELRVAAGGRVISGAPDGNDLVSHVSEVQALAPSIICGLIGANDLSNASAYPTANDYYNALVAHWQALRAAVPQAKIAWATILPKGAAQPDKVTHNARRATVNPLIRAAVGTYIDAVIDFAADATMGTDAAPDNATLYSDGMHPADGGQSYLEAVYAPVVNALAAAGNTWVDSPWSNDVTGTLDAPVIVATTTFDPARKSQFVTLSNGNLTANGTAGEGACTPVMSTTSRNPASGTLYAELMLTVFNGSFAYGICNNNEDPVVANKVNFPPAGSAVFLNGDGRNGQDATGTSIDTGFDENGNFVGITSGFNSTPQVLGVICDFTARKISFTRNGVLMGGHYAMPAGAIYLFAGPAIDTDTAVLNCGQTAFSYQPAGSAMWG